MVAIIDRRRILEIPIPEMPLGRNVHFDSRSGLYPFVPRELREIAAVLHQRHIGPLDQAQMGSCTGNALVGAVATSPNFEALSAGYPPLDEALAVKAYCLAVVDGQNVPCSNDPGSDGIDICKAGQKLGLIGGYTHCIDVTTMQQALMERPVLIGINWYSSFDHPDSSGFVSIASGAYIRGGHEVEVLGMDPATGFLAENSWGPGWGYHGTFQFSFDTMARLLAEQGDCMVPLPDAVTPTPSPPAPEPAALPRELDLAATLNPWVAQTRTRPDLVILKSAILRWKAKVGV